MPLLIAIVIAILLIGLSTNVVFAGGVDMKTIQSVYDAWNDLAQNWADVSAHVTKEEILAIIVAESSGNALAVNPNDPSYGLMGVTELIGRRYGRINVVEDLYTPAKNIQSGAGFLDYLKGKYSKSYPLGNDNGWIQMYNEGETKFLNGIRASVGYEQAFLRNIQMVQEYEATLQGG